MCANGGEVCSTIVATIKRRERQTREKGSGSDCLGYFCRPAHPRHGGLLWVQEVVSQEAIPTYDLPIAVAGCHELYRPRHKCCQGMVNVTRDTSGDVMVEGSRRKRISQSF